MHQMPAERIRTSNLRKQIREIERLGETDFLRLEFDLVSHYRRHADDQEWIAVELTRKNLAADDEVAKGRVSEIMAMLDHVHDPLISTALN
jgi:hypothetical protein